MYKMTLSSKRDIAWLFLLSENESKDMKYTKELLYIYIRYLANMIATYMDAS